MSKNTRQVATRSLSLGTPVTVGLPRNYAIRNIALRLAGSATLSSGSASGAVKSQGINHLLGNLRVRRNGNDTLISIPGWLLYELNKVLYGQAPALTNLASGDEQANTAVDGTLIIPFENLGGIKPFDTLLKAAGLSSLDFLVDTVGLANVFTAANDRTKAVGTTPFTLDVTINEEVGVNNFVFGDTRTYLAHKIAVTGASSSFQIKPIGVGNQYKGFLLFVEDAEVGSDDIINNIKLKSGSQTFIDIAGNLLQEQMQAEKDIPSLSAGVYYIDLMPDGRLNQSLDVRPQTGRETLEFELNVAAPSGTCNIYVVALEYIAPVVVKK